MNDTDFDELKDELREVVPSKLPEILEYFQTINEISDDLKVFYQNGEVIKFPTQEDLLDFFKEEINNI